MTHFQIPGDVDLVKLHTSSSGFKTNLGLLFQSLFMISDSANEVTECLHAWIKFTRQSKLTRIGGCWEHQGITTPEDK